MSNTAPDTAAAEIDVKAPDEAATLALAARIAAILRAGDVVTLTGPLGAGKSTLARAILRALGEEGEVPSPTFTLVQTYAPAGAAVPVHHFDCYRLAGPEDARELDMEDAFATGISVIEWAENIAALLPADRLDITITLDDTDDAARTFTLRGRGTWSPRVKEVSA